MAPGDTPEGRMGGLVPLEHMSETLLHDGAQWTHEAGGKAWVIRWFSGSGNVTAWPYPASRRGKTHRGHAENLESARREVLRIVNVIDGRKG